MRFSASFIILFVNEKAACIAAIAYELPKRLSIFIPCLNNCKLGHSLNAI